MKQALLFCFIFLCSGQVHSFPRTPDPDLSPGHLCQTSDPDFEEFRYNGRVAYCKRRVSSSLKDSIKSAYGIRPKDFHQYVVDHVIPLSIGGSNHPKNLWPQHKCIRRSQLRWENTLYLHVKKGRYRQARVIDFVLNTKFNEDVPLRECD